MGIPIGARLGTPDARAAHAALVAAHAGLVAAVATVQEDVLRLDFAPPMFRFDDQDGNLLVYIADA